MPTINIFLGSSNELKPEREAFETFISRHSNTWIDTRQTTLRLRIWEDFEDNVSQTRLQDEYNKAITSSQIFVMMFWTKVGKYTNEEFEVALKRFNDTGLPLVYTYLKTVDGGTTPEPSLQAFKRKLEGIGHFPTSFTSTEAFLLHFSLQLEKVYHTVIQQAPMPAAKAKADLLALVNKLDFAAAINVLYERFGDQNIVLNALVNEYISPPANFNAVGFANRLKVFINTQF